MRNRAKCRLCKTIVESFHQYDHVSCKCGEISITGGNYAYECSARDFNNFLRVDDNDHEISVKVKEKEEGKITPIQDEIPFKPSREALLTMLDAMIADIDKMPSYTKTSPITHLDHQSLLLLLSSLFRS